MSAVIYITTAPHYLSQASDSLQMLLFPQEAKIDSVCEMEIANDMPL